MHVKRNLFKVKTFNKNESLGKKFKNMSLHLLAPFNIKMGVLTFYVQFLVGRVSRNSDSLTTLYNKNSAVFVSYVGNVYGCLIIFIY